MSPWRRYFGSRGDFGQLSPAPAAGPAWLRAYDPAAFALVDRIYSGEAPVKPIRVRALPPRGACAQGPGAPQSSPQSALRRSARVLAQAR